MKKLSFTKVVSTVLFNKNPEWVYAQFCTVTPKVIARVFGMSLVIESYSGDEQVAVDVHPQLSVLEITYYVRSNSRELEKEFMRLYKYNML